MATFEVELNAVLHYAVVMSLWGAGKYGGLNWNGSISLIYLNAWSPGSSPIWRHSLVGSVALEVGFAIPSA